MISNLNILLVSDHEQLSAQIKQALNEEQFEEITPQEVPKEFDRLTPDLVFYVEPQTGEPSSVEMIQYMVSLNQNVRIVYLAQQSNFELLRGVTRAGAIDFFVLPDEISLLFGRIPALLNQVRELKQVQSGNASSVSFKKGRGQIYTFYSGKGGAGKTLLSSAFAQTMKFESTAQILLIDLNLQYGGIETVFSVESNRSLADLKPVISELNESHIHNVSSNEEYSKLQILLSPSDAEIAETINEEFVSTLLRNCRRNFDFVVVDLPSHMNSITYTALNEADKIYYVLTPDTLALKTLKKVEEMFFRLGINTEERFKLIYNKVGRDNEIQPKDMNSFLTYPVEAKITNDVKGVQPLVNKGIPLRKHSHEKKLTALAKDIQKWVHTVLK